MSQRLGRNHGGYFGETIDIASVVSGALRAAQEHGWRSRPLVATPAITLHALHRPARPLGAEKLRRIYLSTGIHGDEPAGPLAVERLLREDAWPDGLELWCCPCLNPTGFPLNTRENAAGIDLNRDYRHLRSPEVRAHIAWLRELPEFDLAFCLHEDWESHGFYIYEANGADRPSQSQAMLEAVAAVCPLDLSPEIEGRPASGGLIRPNLDPASRPHWPEAFYLLQHKTRLSYTLEAPSDFPLPVRVEALVVAVRAALRAVAG